MSDNQEPVDKPYRKVDRITKQHTAYGAGIGIGGGLVGGAIGGLLGRRVGGVFGAVVGTVAGALVGRGTAERVNRTVESVVDAAKTAKSAAEAVNQSVNGVGNALKDTVEEVKPSVIGIVDALKDTVEEVKPSVVGTAKTFAESFNHTVNRVNGVEDAFKDTVEEVKSAVVGTAKSVAEAVNQSVNSAGNTLKDTVEEIKPSLIGVIDAAKDTVEGVKPAVIGAANSVAEAVNRNVNGAENALKDEVEEVKLSVIGVEDAAKGTAFEVKPSVGAAESVAEGVNYAVNSDNGAGNVLEDTVEEVKPSVIPLEDAAKGTAFEVKPSDNHNSQLYEEGLAGVQLLRSSQEHTLINDVNEPNHQRLKSSQESNNVKEIDVKPPENKNIQRRQEEFQPNQQETAQELKQKRVQLQTEKILKISGIILGAAAIVLMGVTLGFSQKQNLLGTKLPQLGTNSLKSKSGTKFPERSQTTKSPKQLGTKSSKFNQRLSPTPKTTSETNADGWIFLGSINNASASALVGKPLIQGSQTTNLHVVPSVGSIVTVTTGAGVTLRKNKPQEPNFNYKEQKALANIKFREKLKILKVEYVTPSNTTQPVRKVWAKVHKCGMACN